jgi:hypothetical protein
MQPLPPTGPQPENNLALIQVTVEFDRPDESMTVNVPVPNEGDEKALIKLGMAKAKSFAQRFADFPNTTE